MKFRIIAIAIASAALATTLPAAAAEALPSAGRGSATSTSVPTEATATSLSAAAAQQVEFILSKQLPSGAIQKTDGHIEPYAANTAALGLLASGTTVGRTATHKWMEWTLTHLNVGSDVDGLSYTISDWSVADGQEQPHQGNADHPVPYDSVDSYAATTLMVAEAAYRTGDPELQAFVEENILTYEAIANLLTYAPPNGVRMPDGLTRALGRFSSEYTMDNSEVFAGLKAFGALEYELGRATEEYNYYDIWAGTTRNAMREHLFTGDGWDLAKGSAGNGEFYQSGMPNYFPIVFGVTSATSPESVTAWDALRTRWPHWATREIGTCAPATSLAASGITMGNDDDAQTLLEQTVAAFATDSWSYPATCPQGTDKIGSYWHSGEAGWFLIAAKGLGVTPAPEIDWNDAINPAGSAKVEQRGTIGGGVWLHEGWYYLPTAGHVVYTLGNPEIEFGTGRGMLGRTSHSTRANGESGMRDIGLVATGTRPIEPRVRISNTAKADISRIATPADLTAGTEVCHSGTSTDTLAAGGYRCGTLTKDCKRSSELCDMMNAEGVVSSGDSGGLVWIRQPDDSITLVGWVSARTATAGYFVPAWALQDHTWTASQTWVPGNAEAPPFPTGRQDTGCFVTTAGCVRVE
ncbi:hypothetical protein [Microbacterium oxydans]|uniref:hypothetical protein n=1 Tax=Microbacterium oxydans TaxID=82380 RepID=UPI00226B49DE|nr:hypothetical protein [Microbacterium oxydans]WAA65600.1 S1 family peptidase [Microbacterium oxydans]